MTWLSRNLTRLVTVAVAAALLAVLAWWMYFSAWSGTDSAPPACSNQWGASVSCDATAGYRSALLLFAVLTVVGVVGVAVSGALGTRARMRRITVRGVV